MNAPLAYPLLAAPTAAWRRSLPALALLLLAIGALYYDSFRAMVLIWERSDTFAHAFIVPPIALWLIWRQREVLAQHSPRPTPWLLLPLAGVGLAWLLGRLVAVNSVMQLCATAMLVLAVPLVLGRRVALLILFPLNYLFFAVPIGEFLMPQLMQSTADFTVAALRLSGIPVYREGLQFVIPSGNWSVVEACSGVRYLMASFMVGSLFAYLNYRSWRRRLVFGVVSLLVPVVANWLRAYMIVMLGHLSGNKLAVGVDHLIYGWVFFGVVITLVFMIGARWAEAPAAAALPRAADIEAPDSSAKRGWGVAVLGALILALPLLALQRIDAAERPTAPRLDLPNELAGGWQRDAAAADLWKPAFQNPSSELVTRYVAADGQAVGVYLAFYSGQNDDRKLVSSENVLVPTKDPVWNPVETDTRELSLNERSVTFRQTRLLHNVTSSAAEREQMLVWQLYWVDGRLMHQDMQAKLAGAWQRLRGQGDASAAVVLYAMDQPGKPAARVLKDFASANLSMIEAGLNAREGSALSAFAANIGSFAKSNDREQKMSTVAVIGLGYVGLPLVVAFGKQMRTIGFDIAVAKVESCQRGVDPSRELPDEELAAATQAVYTADGAMLAEADIIIVAVPTPVDEAHIPDFRPLIGSSTSVGRNMKKGAIVVYESTVYPGATEEVCIPVLERESGLKWKQDFFVGYSPERINPGDKEHTLTKILKIVSGDTPETLDKVAAVYEKIIVPGVHRASSIKAAEAAKVIENTQRDLNIALMNELSIIFDKLGIDTTEVLEAAGTKWNFLKFKPGLVGGHCIGVDPYYLTHKAEMLGYHPQVILAGRRINDGMGKFIAEQTIKQMIAAGSYIKGAKVNVLGLTFKENCGDLRNSKVIDIINELKSYGVEVHVTDPQAESDEAMHEYGVRLSPWDELPRADAIVAAVSHREFAALSIDDLGKKMVKGGAFIDVKAAFDAAALQVAGFRVWRL